MVRRGTLVPKWTEIAVTGAIIAAGFALFGVAVRYLPIFPEQERKLAIEEEAPTLTPLSDQVEH